MLYTLFLVCWRHTIMPYSALNWGLGEGVGDVNRSTENRCKYRPKCSLEIHANLQPQDYK